MTGFGSIDKNMLIYKGLELGIVFFMIGRWPANESRER